MKKYLLLFPVILSGCVQPHQIHRTHAYDNLSAAMLSDEVLCERVETGLGTSFENKEAASRDLKCYSDHKSMHNKLVKSAAKDHRSEEQKKEIRQAMRQKPGNGTIADQVLSDSIDQYNITDRSGSAMDKCVQAGMVKAAALQAKREDYYKFWSDIHKLDCLVAGVPGY